MSARPIRGAQQARQYLDIVEHVESARTLPELVERLQRARFESPTLADQVAAVAIRRAKKMGFQFSCTYPPEVCVDEMVDAVRTRQQLLFNPTKPRTPEDMAKTMRTHCGYVVANPCIFGLEYNPTSVVRAGGRTIFVFDAEGDGHWAQVYDEDGPLGARWYGAVPEDAIELAVEHAHDVPPPAAGSGTFASPGSTAQRAALRKRGFLG